MKNKTKKNKVPPPPEYSCRLPGNQLVLLEYYDYVFAGIWPLENILGGGGGEGPFPRASFASATPFC